MCSVQCTVCSEQCAVCSVQCAVNSVQYAVCSVQCAAGDVCWVLTTQYLGPRFSPPMALPQDQIRVGKNTGKWGDLSWHIFGKMGRFDLACFWCRERVLKGNFRKIIQCLGPGPDYFNCAVYDYSLLWWY